MQTFSIVGLIASHLRIIPPRIAEVGLEEKFGTCLADEQMEAVKTVQDLFDCLEAALASERALSPSQQK